MVISSVQELIGNTPMIKFTNKEFAEIPEQSSIYAKLEYLNPGGSIKDRLGQYLLQEAFQGGTIDTNTTIIEPTAGNTGIGIALSALRWGLKTIFVVPEKFSQEKQALMVALGAQIIHSPTEKGMKGAIELANQLQKEIPNSYVPMQFENEANPAAYSYRLGPEIVAELGEEITSFVAGIGSGGTFSGVATFLQTSYPLIRLIGVEPAGSILNGGPSHSHEIEGIGVEFFPPFLKNLDVTSYETISDSEGFAFTRELAKKHGLLIGSSSGAAMAAAIKEVQRLENGSRVVTIFPDAGDRYLSKNIYSQEEYQDAY